MPTLGNIHGGSLVPDLSGSLNLALQAKDRHDQQQAAQQKQQQVAGLIDQIGGSSPGFAGGQIPMQGKQKQQALLRLAQLDPKLAESMQGIIQSNNEAAIAREQSEVENGLRQAVFIGKQSTHEGKLKAIREFAVEADRQGRPIDKYVEMSNLSEPELDLRLQKMQVMGSDLKTLLGPAEAPQTRELKQGDQIITQQFNPNTGEYENIAQADRFNQNAGVTVNVGGEGAAPAVVTPPALLEGLPENVAKKVDATFIAANGGKDGIDAINKVMSEFDEQERRTLAPNILKNSFPQATPAEMAEIEATMSAAPDTQSGLAEAQKVRTEQRRLEKAKSFQARGVELLNKILASDQIGDVTGSLEGSYDLRVGSDAEAELISDINEAQNILTADNLSLMSGVLSETDIKILADLAGGALNRTRTEKRFVDDVTTLLNKLSSKMVETVNDKKSPPNLNGGQSIGRFTVRPK